MSPRALITGCEGFVGTALTAHLASADWDVVGCGLAIDRDTPFRFRCDFRSADSIREAISRAVGVTHVFHLAAMTFVPDTDKDPLAAYDTNLDGTIRLIETMQTLAPAARLVFVGSSEAYGVPQFLPITEDHPLAPANPYAIGKAAADLHCAWAYRVTGADIVRVRPFNHTGPGQSDRFALPSFARQIAEIECGLREPVLRVGNLDGARDFSHVTDMLRAYERIALDGKPGAAYNVCSGHSVSLKSALDEMLGMAHARIGVTADPERYRPNEVPEICGSHAALSSATGWRPEKSFRNLLEDILGYWRAHVAAGKAH